MKLEIIDKKKDRMSFLLTGAKPSFANMLRRVIKDEVPAMAIEDVEFRKNSSILYDEMIAHRLGLVPLKTDLESYNLPEECTCKGEGCAKCQVTGSLKAKGPAIVYASELKFKDPAIKPVYPKMPITKLLKGQELEIEVTAVLGKGKEHAKWSPGHVWYKYKPYIEIVKNPDNAEEIVKICPKDVFEIKNKKLAIKNLDECHLCGACVDIANGDIKLNEKDTEFIFYVESFGQLDCSEIVKVAVETVEKQLEEFGNLLNKPA